MLVAPSLLLATLAFAAVAQHPSANRAPITQAQTAADTACRKLRYANDPDTISSRERNVSPLDSVTFRVGGKPVKICYSRPSARGRIMLGGHPVPYGKLWRTGANEPTLLFTPMPLTFAGLTVPGAYSFYTLPGATAWIVIVNRSTAHWGRDFEETQAHELGCARVPRGWPLHPVETFTIRPEPTAAAATAVVLEWERTRRVRIPIAPH